MSALGHKRTLAAQWAMSALPPKADIRQSMAGLQPASDCMRAGLCEHAARHAAQEEEVFLPCLMIHNGTISIVAIS
jgi:hypothetical protein